MIGQLESVSRPQQKLKSVLVLVTLLVIVPTVCATAASSQDALLDVRAYRQAYGASILRSFSELLSIPNVASDSENITKNAEYLRQELERRGVDAELWHESDAPPIVYGSLRSGANRTIGIYVHYDGQPVDPQAWTNPPWNPTLYTAAIEAGGTPRPLPSPGDRIDSEWRLYARSAGDDKAPLAAIFTALDALARSNIDLTSNLVFLFEGEEEAGSNHLGDYFRQHRDDLQVDLWLICDGPVHQSRRPQLVFGVRGYTGFEITVYGANRYLHSGHYGNWAPNPAQNLSILLATMKDEEGRVLIEGFYESTTPASDAERAAMDEVPKYDDQLRHDFGLVTTEANNASIDERLLLPSFNIRGLASATVGKDARNVIPIEAHASVDIRLAKGNDPGEMLDLVEDHIESQGYKIVREEPNLEIRRQNPRIVRFTRNEGYPAARTDMDLPVIGQVLEAAEQAAGETIIRLPTLGGSLPLYLFNDVLEAPLVVVPIANHDNNQHAPDENLRIANLWYGIDLMASLFTMAPSPMN